MYEDVLNDFEVAPVSLCCYGMPCELMSLTLLQLFLHGSVYLREFLYACKQFCCCCRCCASDVGCTTFTIDLV